ncbi:hypothetical protein VFPPC_16627 [Pochonia chlamydosporia 170]|uniref:Uncharacterized protein n=1 Tax=Pochonia chlamydosporia 170 TaxID=1380566 RepID=A0A179F9X1_METCM|nr:hypothetical protein VFPPC_16627 [Pochonia chlamydosporia 170]OAQ62238.1 hypothetical protein VFPPC_16627 [Pochonia chlamydosporia 170]
MALGHYGNWNSNPPALALSFNVQCSSSTDSDTSHQTPYCSVDRIGLANIMVHCVSRLCTSNWMEERSRAWPTDAQPCSWVLERATLNALCVKEMESDQTSSIGPGYYRGRYHVDTSS